MDAPPELKASKKNPCPSCGGESVWNPKKQALVCPFCGTTTVVEEKAGEVVEHDLVAALRDIPDEQRGWEAEKTSVKCQHCQAISVFDPGRVGQRCDFCGSSQLVPYEESKLPFRPESVLPLKISEPQVRDSLKDWYGRVWFAPNNLSRISRADTLKGFYLPFWTFDAQVEADWDAEAGFYYYTTETYTDSDGEERTRQVQHTRWESASGHLNQFFDDELVPASIGVDPTLLEQAKPFPTSELIPYQPSYVTGWIVEHYQIDLVAAAQKARDSIEAQVRSLCSSAVPGDTQRGLSVDTEFSAQTFKHILAPVWLVSYTYGSTAYQVVVNGVTGKVCGKYPKSWIKITLAIIGALIAALIFLAIVGSTSGH